MAIRPSPEYADYKTPSPRDEDIADYGFLMDLMRNPVVQAGFLWGAAAEAGSLFLRISETAIPFGAAHPYIAGALIGAIITGSYLHGQNRQNRHWCVIL